MGGTALAIAAASVASLFVPRYGMYLALGASILALGLGWTAYRRRENSGSSRLTGAGAVFVGGIAIVLAIAKIALTLGVIGAAEDLLS